MEKFSSFLSRMLFEYERAKRESTRFRMFSVEKFAMIPMALRSFLPNFHNAEWIPDATHRMERMILTIF